MRFKRPWVITRKRDDGKNEYYAGTEILPDPNGTMRQTCVWTESQEDSLKFCDKREASDYIESIEWKDIVGNSFKKTSIRKI